MPTLLDPESGSHCRRILANSHRAHTVVMTHVLVRSSADQQRNPKSPPNVLGNLTSAHAPHISALLAPSPATPAPASAHSTASRHLRARARHPRVLPRAPAPGPTRTVPACSAAPSYRHPVHGPPACSPSPSHPHSEHSFPACPWSTWCLRGGSRHATPPPRRPVAQFRTWSCQTMIFRVLYIAFAGETAHTLGRTCSLFGCLSLDRRVCVAPSSFGEISHR